MANLHEMIIIMDLIVTEIDVRQWELQQYPLDDSASLRTANRH